MEMSPFGKALSFQCSKNFQKLIVTLSLTSHVSLLTRKKKLVSFDLQ